ncbi:MFS transporter [Nitriliruptor alkaliphilus]|uniref:MFS transporter n=1 Tax=Nitriliruptor alkaliphilus TaxID=427918 RepID=UPI000AC2301C|nr:MFS transporter [Nitriliruptor alkaliphilus]
MLLSPVPPRARTRFSGWRVVLLAAVALGMTGPGQTAGVSVFVDPMMGALELSRSQVSTAYLIGTLGGAVAMPRVGRLIDDRGARVAMGLVGGIFGVVLAAMAGVVGVVTLVLGFTGIRAFGQGGLSLVATTAVAPWFRRRRGIAIGVTAAVGSALLSLIPILSAFVIGEVGWRLAWICLALLTWAVILPIAFRGLIDRPSDVGQQVDGDPIPADGVPVTVGDGDLTRADALRTPMFWAVAGAVAATGMIGTGLAFHQIDLLGEQGLTPVQAAANFLPQTVAALTATLFVGSMVDRFAPRWVLLTSMLLLAGAMVAVPFVGPGVTAALYGMAVGAAGSSVRALEAAAFPKLFGIRHLGSIRGVVTAISVASTAFGPVALSFGRDLTGSYIEVLMWLLVVPIGVGIFGLVARAPGGTTAD